MLSLAAGKVVPWKDVPDCHDFVVSFPPKARGEEYPLLVAVGGAEWV